MPKKKVIWLKFKPTSTWTKLIGMSKNMEYNRLNPQQWAGSMSTTMNKINTLVPTINKRKKK